MDTRPPTRPPAWQTAVDWVQDHFAPGNWPLFSGRQPEQHNQIYDQKYYEFVEAAAIWSREVMADSIVRDLAPRHVLDIGCGTGALLEAIKARGVEVNGLEYSDAGLEMCRKRGLPVQKFQIGRDPLPAELKACDVAMSFEVAEHLPERLANKFVRLLCNAPVAVILSAATPGQGGTDHLNEQPHEYWIEKMARRRFQFDEPLSLSWREQWRDRTATWYYSNVMVFRRT